jgi:guanylate kinase
MEAEHISGTLLVLIGPSGAGKSAIQQALVEVGWERVVSSTTRPRREGEKPGTSYNFYTLGDFEALEEAGEFIETEDIYGHRYGLERASIDKHLRAGDDAVVVLGIGGARQVLTLYPQARCVFVQPESREALTRRLVARGADTRRVETIDDRHVDFRHRRVTNRTGQLDEAVAEVILYALGLEPAWTENRIAPGSRV